LHHTFLWTLSLIGISVQTGEGAQKQQPAQSQLPILLLAVALGNLPDWLEAPYYLFFAKPDKKGPTKTSGFWEQLTYKIYKLENIFHSKAPAPFGVYTQIATVAFFFLLLR
jgi:hypothetical protein